MPAKIPKGKWEYKSEAFDKFFAEVVSSASPKEMESVPLELSNKIFRYSEMETKYLLDTQKDYILSVSLGRQVLKVVLDLDKGLSIAQYTAMRDEWRLKKKSGVNASVISEEMINNGEFVRAGRDLYDAIQYQAMLCYSPLFKMILNTRKEAKKFKHATNSIALGIASVVEMLATYESNKKKIVVNYDISEMSEWYALLHFYNSEKKNSSLYMSGFLYGYNCNKQSLKKALGTLKVKGYLQARGGPKNMMTSITPKGRELVDKIIMKHILTY